MVFLDQNIRISFCCFVVSHIVSPLSKTKTITKDFLWTYDEVQLLLQCAGKFKADKEYEGVGPFVGNPAAACCAKYESIRHELIADRYRIQKIKKTTKMKTIQGSQKDYDGKGKL